MTQDATPAPWRASPLGSEGCYVYGPQGTRPGGHRLAMPIVARCTHEAHEVDGINAYAIVALRNAAGALLGTAQIVLTVHRPTADQDTPGWTDCAGCPGARRWPCPHVEPLLNGLGIGTGRV